VEAKIVATELKLLLLKEEAFLHERSYLSSLYMFLMNPLLGIGISNLSMLTTFFRAIWEVPITKTIIQTAHGLRFVMYGVASFYFV